MRTEQTTNGATSDCIALNAELDAMREAIMQLLDDMGPNGHSVCEAAKQKAIKAVHAHYCPDWDYLPICPSDPEVDGCICQASNEKLTSPPLDGISDR